QTAEASELLVRRWGLLSVPAGLPQVLTAFTASGEALVFLFWADMPVAVPHAHELYQKEPPKIEYFKPAEALQRTEILIAQAESAVKALEAKAKQGAKGKAPQAKGAKQPSAKVGAQEGGGRTR